LFVLWKQTNKKRLNEIITDDQTKIQNEILLFYSNLYKTFINYKAGCDSLFGKIRNHIHKLKEEDKVLIDGELTLEMDIALKQRVIVNQLLIF